MAELEGTLGGTASHPEHGARSPRGAACRNAWAFPGSTAPTLCPGDLAALRRQRGGRGLAPCLAKKRRVRHHRDGRRERGEGDCNFLSWTVARALGLTLLIVGKAS